MSKCRARIMAFYKTKKADSFKPREGEVYNDDETPICGGDVTAEVTVDDRSGACGDPECCGRGYDEVFIDLTCSKCKNPIVVEDWYNKTYPVSDFLSELVQRYIDGLEGPKEPKGNPQG